MGTYMESWAFDKRGRRVRLSEDRARPFPIQDYRFFAALDGCRMPKHSTLTPILGFGSEGIIDEFVWVSCPWGDGYGMYCPKIVDEGSGRTEFDVYGPQTYGEYCIDQFELTSVVYDANYSPVRMVTIDQLMATDWDQRFCDPDDEDCPVHSLGEWVGHDIIDMITALKLAGVHAVLYAYH